LKKFEIRTERSTKNKPTQLSGFLFIPKIFSSPQFHHHRYRKEVEEPVEEQKDEKLESDDAKTTFIRSVEKMLKFD